jgi:putative glutamine amidotransferase
MKPRIGVTSSPSLHEDRFLEALDRAFVSAVISAGGLPFVLPVLAPEEASSVLACLDGILFSGGGDVDPACYAGPSSHAAQGIEPERDAYEIALARAGVDLGLPMFGICRGCQVLNVALGGTLVQHLPDVSDQQHCAKEQWAEAVHTVRVLPESRLGGVVGLDVVGVNSLHHQAVDGVGDGLHAVAWADDGTIEAVEGMGPTRVLAVQWHPELLMRDPSHAALFEWLVEEAGRPISVPGVPAASEVLAPLDQAPV